MDKLIAESIGLLLLFAAFPIISFGASRATAAVWVFGLLCLIIGGLLPIVTRFMDHSRDKPTDMGMEFDERAS